MSHCIYLQAPRQYPLDAPRLKQAAAAVLKQRRQPPGSCLTIVIAHDDQMRELNRKHRQLDAPTDVLSFPAAPLPDGLADGGNYLGDIVIAYPYAAAHAEQRRVHLDDVLCLLVVHAALHLLGYDHDSAAARRRMWAAQAEALHSLRMDVGIVAAYEGTRDDEAHPRRTRRHSAD